MTLPEDMRKIIFTILPLYAGSSDDRGVIDDIMLLIEEVAMKTEKAYGGCRKCYGKGYATVNDRWLAHDTDQDIGSPGGYILGGNANAIKFCTCDRGQQLSKGFEQVDRKVRIEENELAYKLPVDREERRQTIELRLHQLQSPTESKKQ